MTNTKVQSVKVLAFMLAVSVALLGIYFLVVPKASAGEAFLCPVVGDGVIKADENNGDNGVSVINPPVGTAFLPGNNQAGVNADPNAYNTEGPGDPDAGPGGNPDFSPIWPSS